jgi:hypothetical protein
MIVGIAVYPLHIRHPAGGFLPSKCDFTRVRCENQVEVPLDPDIQYRLICAAEDPQGADFWKIAVKGSIKKKFGAMIIDHTLEEKSLNKQNVGIDGTFRQFWDWPFSPSDWKKTGGIYEVTLSPVKKSQTDGGPETVLSTIKFNVKFTKPEYDKPEYQRGEYRIDKHCI